MYLCTLATCHKSEQSSDGIVLRHRCESFVIILSPSLSKPLGAKAGFVATVVLDSEYPTYLNNFDIGRLRYQGPDIIVHNGFILSLYRLLPLFCIFPIHCFPIIRWPNRGDVGSCHLCCHLSKISSLSMISLRSCCIGIGCFMTQSAETPPC